MNELVSIIIPAYNSEGFIMDTLVSVQKQTYTNWECIIVNDGSTDNTEDVVLKFINNQIDNDRYVYHKQQNTGLSGARNKGLSLSKGEYIQFVDSDDILFPDKIEIMLNHYSKEGKVNEIYFCDFIFTNDEDPYQKNETQYKLYKDISSISPIDFQKIYAEWDYKLIIPPHCFLYPKELIEDIYFDQNLKSKEDWDFYLSILSNKKIKFRGLKNSECAYRVRKNSMSQDYTNLIRYTLLVLNKWKNRNYFHYLNRMSFYVLQAYIYKLGRKNKINLKVVFQQLKEIHPKNYMLIVLLIFSLIPLQFVKKMFNVIRIRRK